MGDKNNEKDTKTPSGRYDSPINVAITGSMLNNETTDFETIIVRTVAQVIYGDVASTARSMKDIGNFSKKNHNPFDIAENTLKKIESLEKLHKETNNILRPIASSVIRLAMFTGSLLGLAASNTGFIVTPTEKPNIPGQDSGDSAQTIKVAIESNNLDDILKALSDLSGDGSLSTLADVFEVMVDNSKGFKEIAEYMQPFSESMAKLIEQNKGIEEFTKIIDPFIKGMNNMSKIKFIDGDELSKVGDALLSFSQTKISESDINSIVNSAKTVIDNLSEIDLSNINVNQFDLLRDVTDKISILNNIKSTDLSSLDDLGKNIPKINSFAEELSKVEKINKKQLTNFNTLVDWLDELKFPAKLELTREFDQQLSKLTDSFLPKIQNLVPQLNALKINKIKEKQFSNLNDLIDQLNNIHSFNLIFNFDEDNIEAFENLSIAMPNIVKIADGMKAFPEEANENIDRFTRTLKRLSELNFDGKEHKIDNDALRDIMRSIPMAQDIISIIAKEMDQTDNKKVVMAVGQLSAMLKNLEEMKFTGENSINTDKLQELNRDILPSIIESSKILIKSDLSKYIKSIADILSKLPNVVDNLDRIRFDGEYNINKSKLEELNDALPIIVKALKNVIDVDLQPAPKNLKYLVSGLKVIEEIDTAQFEDKNLKPVAEIMSVMTNISDAMNKFDNSSVAKVDSLTEFVNRMFVEETSPIKKVINSDEIKPKDIQKAKDYTNVAENLSNAAKCVAILGPLKPMIDIGLAVLIKFNDKLKDLIKNIGKTSEKDIKNSQQIMKGMCMLVAVSTVCMLIGGFFVVKMPELVLGALLFTGVLGLFIAATLKAITWASKGLVTSMETMKGVALLIMVCTATMLIGALFVTVYPQLALGALAFTAVLGLFILWTLAAIRWGAAGMKDSMKTLREFAILIAASALTLIMGGLFITLYPKLIFGSFIFGALLGGFMLGMLNAIKFGTKGIKAAEKQLREFAILIGVSALTLILGGLIVTAYPKIIAGAIAFTGVLGLFIWGVLKAIKKGTKGIEQALINIKMFSVVVGVSAGVLLIGGGLFAAFPDLAWSTPLFAVTLAGFIYIVGLALKQLGNQSKDIIKGAAAMAIIGGVVVLGAGAMLIIANAMDHGILEVAAGALIMSATLGIVALMTVAMGTAASNPFFWMGVAAMAAVSGIVMVGALAMLTIAKSLKIFKEVGEFNLKPMLNNITGLISIAAALIPIGLMSPAIVAASVAVSSLSIAISEISAAVAEAASLKIPIYAGTKKVGYRSLKQTDFKDAARNIKQIVTVLGKAIIDIYNKNPEMFNTGFRDNKRTPFTIVVESTTGLAKLISKISKSVKDFAELKIPKYSGTKVVGYDYLKPDHFKEAATNISSVITILGGTLIDTYNKNKTMFEDTNIFTNKPGNTPLSRTITVTMQLGKLISKIASGIQDFADLNIKEYGENGKVVKKTRMNGTDITNAANNVKYIVECLSKSLIELYKENKTMFDDGNIFTNKPGNTPLSRTIAVNMQLGKLISKIASGVQDFADLNIKEYGKDGKIVKKTKMTPNDIKAAAENVKFITECLAKSLIELYKANKTMFDDGNIFTNKPGNTPLSRTIAVNMQLGKLISKIADGVQKFGNLTIPIEWNKDGKAVKFQQMSSKDIKNAINNVNFIVSTLGEGLMESYKEHDKWYKEPESLFGSIFGGGGNAKKTPFYTVISVNLRLAELISNIGKAVGNMAKLTIPIEWNKDGKAIKFRQLTSDDFNLAGENIGKIITTLGNAVMGQYDSHKDWFTDEDGDIVKDGKNKFSIVMKSTLRLSEIIKNIASGIKDYSNLLIPDDWDKNGKAIHYREMTKTDFTNASDNIGTVVTTIGNSLMDVFKDKKEWFETDDGWFSSGDSDFNKVMTGCTAMGEMISSISSGIIALAQLQIPIAWNDKGAPIKFREMKTDDFTKASASIKTVVSTVGQALIDLYDARKDLFETSEDNPDSKFAKVAEGCSYLGDMIKGIAEGVVEMATLEETLKKSGINMTVDTYDAAADKIGKVISTVGYALMYAFNDHKDWFNNPPIIEETGGFWGIGGKKVTKPDNSDTPFQKMLKGCTLMGKMIIEIAKGITFFAKITKNPLPDGSVIDINAATKNIETIITTIGGALIKTANSSSFYTIDKLEPIITSVQKSANAVHSVANLMQKIGKGSIPITDKDGKVIDTIPINNETIASAANTIGLVLSGVSTGLDTAKNLMSNSEYNMFAESTKMNFILDNINKAIKIVANNAKILAELGKGEIIVYNSDFSKPLYTIDWDNDELTEGATAISTILSSVAEGVSNAFEHISEKVGWLSGNDKDLMELMLNSTSKAMEVVGKNAYYLARLSKGDVPLITYNHSKKGYEVIDHIDNLTDKTFKDGAKIITTVLTTIAEGVSKATTKIYSYLATDNWEKSKAYQTIRAVEDAKDTVGKMTLFLARLAKGEYVYIDARTKKQRTVDKISKQGMENASNIISSVITNIAQGIANGTNSLKDFKTKDIHQSLDAIETAKDTVGSMALFLAHLGKNEFVYFDTRLKKERRIEISEGGMEKAAKIISSVITNIADGITSAVSGISSSGVWNGFTWVGSTAYYMLECVTKAISSIGSVAYFVANLGKGKYVYHDRFDGYKEKTIENIDTNSVTNASAIITTILTSLSDAISTSVNKFNFTNEEKMTLMFNSLTKATALLGGLAKVVSYYANGEIAEVSIGNDGKMSITRSGAPNVENAKTNMKNIIGGLVEIMKDSSEKIRQIRNIDETINGLNQSLKVVNASIYAVHQITNAKSEIDALKDFNFSSIMTPVLEDIDKVFEKMNSIGGNSLSKTIGNMFSLSGSSPLNSFLEDTNKMVVQSIAIASAPLEESYNKLRNVITSTSETMENFHLPDNFGQQTEELDKFIKSVNTIKIDGVDSLTELLRELNKLGINMGNLDKLTTAISNKLSVTLLNMKQSMDALNKTMIEDGKRKKKHAEQIKKSVSDIRNLMSKTMNVVVKMDDSGGSPGTSTSQNDVNGDGTGKGYNGTPSPGQS